MNSWTALSKEIMSYTLRQMALLPFRQGAWLNQVWLPISIKFSSPSNYKLKKPDALFYEKIGQEIAGFDKEMTLMIGDSLTADIQGGNNAGIGTIWHNPHHLEKIRRKAQPTYEVHSTTKCWIIWMLCSAFPKRG